MDPTGEDNDHDGISTGEETAYGNVQTNPIAYPDRDQDDSDTDGLPDAWEWTYLKTLGFSATDEYDPASAPGATCLALYQSLRPDTDDDGLPDDWERQRVGDLSEEGSTLRDGRTHLARFREDRLRLARHRYGSHVFTYDDSEPRNPFAIPSTSTDPRVVYLRSELGGSMITTYVDTTYQVVESLRVYPGRPDYGRDSGPDDPRPLYHADYTGVSVDGAWSYAFSATPGAGGAVARDLLRTIDGRPWRRTASGARQPSRLAITSLPLTQVGGGAFPFVFRDFPGGKAAFPDFPAPVDGVALYSGLLEPTLDGPPFYGLPRLKPDVGGDQVPLRSPHSFGQLYRYANAYGFTADAVWGPNEVGRPPPGFIHGIYKRSLHPHRLDVDASDSGNLSYATAHVSLRLDYDLAETEFFMEADDALWVFIDGRLALDHRQPSGFNDRYTLASIKQSVEARDGPDTGFLASPSGSCRIDVFSIDQKPHNASLILMSNSPLKPVYAYQVVAESELDADLSYSLVSPPAGMEIDSRTGRIVWDFHALNTDSDPANDITSGAFPVTVQVADPVGRTDTQSFSIHVTL